MSFSIARTTSECEDIIIIHVSADIQKKSGRKEVDDLERQLQSSKALVADLEKTLQERDSELETLRLKVSDIVLQS